ncbi:hypothetical protein AWB81_03862 [Caballeronia arationis]|nr:hypothetical protein AWB81_03862 [Caballeronia arationis]
MRRSPSAAKSAKRCPRKTWRHDTAAPFDAVLEKVRPDRACAGVCPAARFGRLIDRRESAGTFDGKRPGRKPASRERNPGFSRRRWLVAGAFDLALADGTGTVTRTAMNQAATGEPSQAEWTDQTQLPAGSKSGAWSCGHGFSSLQTKGEARICLLCAGNPAQLSLNCIDCVGEAAVYKIETAASTFEKNAVVAEASFTAPRTFFKNAALIFSITFHREAGVGYYRRPRQRAAHSRT